ncbi:MAG: metallophosphoesterase family protein [Bacteroidia bacterium]|nr:metallophosphoesterase family protein [Bacteroidia bacterium]
MKRIGLISDTHGWLDEKVLSISKIVMEVWHAGDFGSMELVDQLRSKWSDLPAGRSDRDGETRLKGVYGNIDGNEIRSIYPEQLVFMCEEVKVMMRHIGGSPPRYNPETKKQLAMHKPQLFISGHSHILKVIYDYKINCLHMNPGAAGKQGWHKVRTIIRFVIDRKDMKDCEVIELGKR